MKKNYLTICVYTLVMSAFGAVLRWWQLRVGSGKEEVLTISGEPAGAALAVVCAVFTAGLAFLVLRLRHGLKMSAQEPHEHKSRSVTWVLPACAAGVLTLVGACMMLLSAGEEKYPLLVRILAIMAVPAGIAMPAVIFNIGSQKAGALTCVGAAAMTAFYAFWLIVSYRNNATEPEIWKYSMEILAIAASMLAAYYLSGEFFQRPMPLRSAFFCDLAAFFCICAIPDGEPAQKLVIIASAAVFILHAMLSTRRLEE